MFAGAACQGQLWRGAINPFRKREIVNIDLSRSGAAANMSRTVVTHTPRSRDDINFLLMFGILCLALDHIDLKKHVYCHNIFYFLEVSFF
jgi:hypothetical protein